MLSLDSFVDARQYERRRRAAARPRMTLSLSSASLSARQADFQAQHRALQLVALLTRPGLPRWGCPHRATVDSQRQHVPRRQLDEAPIRRAPGQLHPARNPWHRPLPRSRYAPGRRCRRRAALPSRLMRLMPAIMPQRHIIPARVRQRVELAPSATDTSGPSIAWPPAASARTPATLKCPQSNRGASSAANSSACAASALSRSAAGYARLRQSAPPA